MRSSVQFVNDLLSQKLLAQFPSEIINRPTPEVTECALECLVTCAQTVLSANKRYGRIDVLLANTNTILARQLLHIGVLQHAVHRLLLEVRQLLLAARRTEINLLLHLVVVHVMAQLEQVVVIRHHVPRADKGNRKWHYLCHAIHEARCRLEFIEISDAEYEKSYHRCYKYSHRDFDNPML